MTKDSYSLDEEWTLYKSSTCEGGILGHHHGNGETHGPGFFLPNGTCLKCKKTIPPHLMDVALLIGLADLKGWSS